MEGSSIDHYEEQLYTMFKSFDVNNEEALDESAVHALCDALQLEERGAALAGALFEECAGGRVTFQRFRSGLLTVLGEEPPARPPDPPPPDTEPPPRLTFGSKRYGRRSRPALPEASEPRAASASRLEASSAASAPRARRSLSAAPDPAAALDHHARIDPEGALALCRDLHMGALDTRIVERIFEDSPTRDATIGEFFERLDSTLARAVGGGGGGELDDDARPSARFLLDEWERAGVRRPRRLLAELGFNEAGADTLHAAALERALDAELRAHGDVDDANGERVRLLGAALALARARARAAACRAEAAVGERDKLRTDVGEANARAALLAREVDENHARLEREAVERLRREGARHAEELRRARAEAQAEQERAVAERVRLQAECARRADAEARLRAELAAAEERARSLEAAAGASAEALAASRAERARAAERAAVAEELAARLAQDAVREAETRAALAEASREVQRLRARAAERAASPPPGPAHSPPPAIDANLSAELDALLSSNSEVQNMDADGDSVAASRAASLRPSDESSDAQQAGTNKLETTSNDPNQAKLSEAIEAKPCETLSEAEAGADAVVPKDALKDALEERDRLREFVKELEGALDAMRVEYEACEEYWTRKQATERVAHEAELRAGDARLAALVARVAAFERRLAPPAPPLYAIPEAAALEAQVAALQTESAAAARAASARVQRLQEQLARAHRRLEALQRRRAEAECARCRRLEAGGAAAGARALRAEAAAQRLHARLLAADVLVKELYVENCQLARP